MVHIKTRECKQPRRPPRCSLFLPISTSRGPNLLTLFTCVGFVNYESKIATSSSYLALILLIFCAKLMVFVATKFAVGIETKYAVFRYKTSNFRTTKIVVEI